MNPDTPPDDGSILYYDADYPSLEIGEARADDAATLARLGLLGDVAFYTGLARATGASNGGPVLEVGCGTGRLTIPLARTGAEVWAVDVNPGMLAQLRDRLAAEAPEVRARVRILEQDAAGLDRPELAARLAILPFNLLMMVPGGGHEARLLAAVTRHLAPGGTVALDVMNPLTLPQDADPAPAPSRPRRHPRTGNPVVRHARAGAVDGDGVQRIAGRYDELLPDGSIRSTPFAFHWRMIGLADLRSRLPAAGLAVDRVHGDFDGAPWTVASRRTVLVGHRPFGHRPFQGSPDEI
ncbi:class I SAM-dependent methyltransferase [Azospirillum sp. HJ39]|uniref:class I SAM-dependent methyltransferase n=1 Tax=Azospirillum sp. HJ39 TaxID=3159496 RepID=UPI003555C98B